jgi:hypothetical protein
VQLHRPEFLSEISAQDARILVVSFAPRPVLAEWISFFRKSILERALSGHPALDTDPFRRTCFASDPELNAYHAYGLGRFSHFVVYGPSILLQYRQWAEAGRTIQRNTEDKLQRGGDFVIDRGGRIVLAHRGRDQSDRPEPRRLLEALRIIA